jgi:hypothetical protein
LSSDDGVQWAKGNGYKLINGTMGYIYADDQLKLASKRSRYTQVPVAYDANRLAYSMALLESV